ncbi:hypothetical protein [Streptomyces sp. TS71-3]|uniref:hypothetical protein n=1 Tax=Streptomyces sp. TS71-3 TaxID=2733862 RepID=UPI001AFCF2BB|nr:hypothetical protein [Streptomyces sp. TS71-3]GHJ40709.1 hypothetical protein Sm713_63180 [Streptomyces sp. TS71-3]
MKHPDSRTESGPGTGLETGLETERDTTDASTGRLRAALTEAAYEITPSRLPLEAIERDGRRRRFRRRAAVLSAGCGLLLVPLAVVGLWGPGSGDADRVTSHPAPPSPSASSRSVSPPAASPPAAGEAKRVVASGRHTRVAPGFELWLTPEGKHWSTPSSPEPEFRSVVDGNVGVQSPGVSLQAETTSGRSYLSGLYYGGKGTASRVVVTTKAGTVQGGLLELPGAPGWGVWYATGDLGPHSTDMDFITAVTVYDTDGKVYAQMRY